MCGIVGAFVFDGHRGTVDPGLLVRMRDRMAHRGPDGEGLWMSPDGRVGLGHRRLSIIDLSTAAGQPMANEDGSLVVVFNGEIYNHAEIRRELEERGGHRWLTDHSDTEVILHAWEEWGPASLDRFRGMFAIGLWDGKRRELTLVRDRIGVKPLYWSVRDGRLFFASEIKALLADPGLSPRIHEEALFHYLSFLCTPAPQTLFDGVKKLSGGCLLTARADGQITERRWWDAWDHVQPRPGIEAGEAAALVLDELRTAVRLRKVSDVPVGVFLSGGIDSSTNAALFSEGETEPVRTFSIGYRGEYDSYRNELDWARLMADRVGARHHELLLDVDDLIDFLPRMVALQDEPIADPVCVPLYYVSKLARDNGVVVCQVGEGADELFWGYPWWKTSLGLQRRADLVPRPLLAAARGLSALAGRELSTGHELLRRASLGQPIFWGGAEAFNDAWKRRLLSPRLRGQFRDLTSWEPLAPIRRRFEEKAWEPSNLHWMTYLDLNLRLPELLLMRVDKMSMGVSLEGRVPFLDHRFVELALSFPERLLTRDGVSKYLLKRAVRGVIPDEIIDRPKQGFGVPVHEWFAGRLGTEMRREIASFTAATDLLDPAGVDEVFDRGMGSQAWFLFNLALWWKEYVK